MLSLVLLLICWSKYACAQQEPYYYQYYNTSHGLPSSEIICLAKDGKGFLWLGTSSGLSMYDGYVFHNYAYSANNELIGYVNVIKKDKKDRLWIGTGAGLFCYKEDKLIKLSAATASPQGVNDMVLDTDTVWLATENGPVTFLTKDLDFSGSKKIILEDYLLPQWYLHNAPMDKRRALLIAKAPDNTVFIAQTNNLFRFTNNKLELLHTTEGSYNKISSIFPISASKIYFDAASREMSLFDNGHTAAIPYKTLYRPCVGENLPGSWYIGTRGAFYFHPQTGTASTHIFFGDAYAVWCTAVLEDNDFLWVASHDGLIKLKPSFFTSYSVLNTESHNDYYAIIELKNGKILLGGNRGMVFEKKETAFDRYKEKLGVVAEMKGFYEDERGWVWMATGYQGLLVLRNNKVERFTVDDGLHDNSVYQFYKAHNGRLYVFGDQGMSEIKVSDDQTISFKGYYYLPNITQHAKFFSGIEAPDGSIWLGGEEGIVYWRNDSLHAFSFGDKKYVVNFMMTDKEGKVWLATSGAGILQCGFNIKNELEIIKQFTEADGLHSLHYLTLLADKDDNIWAGSSKGITLIGRAGKFKNRILHFDESDGFIKPGYSFIRLQQLHDGSIWALTTYGLTSFQPDRLLLSDNPPLVYITQVKQIEENRIVLQDTKNPHNAFGHSNNSFHFDYTALDYFNQEKIRYYYKLDGLDTNWISTGNLHSIGFENLSPGNYSFHVKALNSKGVWSKQDAIYAFTITPPFWNTWWFAPLLLCMMIALAIIVARKRIQFVKRREAKKTAVHQLQASSYKDQLEVEQIINHFATSMNSINSIDDVLWDVVKNCISKLNFDDCVIYMKDENTGALIQKAAWGPKVSEGNSISQPIELAPGKGIVGSVAITGHPEIINDTSVDERYIVDDVRRLSEITVPILNNGEVIGIIDSEHSEKDFYTQRHLQILTTIASLCAVKIKTMQAEQQIMEKEMEVLRLSKDFATSQLTSLRMQMNPHFIFNALNSVQHYILQGNVIEANKYLSKFSKLQREILHCSNQQFISLQTEIDILSRYLELEQNRFGDSFTYQINMTEEIEPEEIRIPPMMLQPFVENAIWHGLMPREKDRRLSIYFDLYNDDILLATLRDNGIGRAASAKLKQDNGVMKHESKGMSMVQQRLQLLQQQYDKPFEATISDITDTNGDVQGTQIMLRIFIGDKKT